MIICVYQEYAYAPAAKVDRRVDDLADRRVDDGSAGGPDDHPHIVYAQVITDHILNKKLQMKYI